MKNILPGALSYILSTIGPAIKWILIVRSLKEFFNNARFLSFPEMEYVIAKESASTLDDVRCIVNLLSTGGFLKCTFFRRGPGNEIILIPEATFFDAIRRHAKGLMSAKEWENVGKNYSMGWETII